MKTILTAKDLCKTYSTGSIQQHVLKNLNLAIKEGEFTVIMGSSGSGKSTLLYALSGMDRPTLGSICFNGQEISDYSNDQLAKFRRQNCGFIFQQNYLNDSMSVMDNILVSGLLVNKNRREITQRAGTLLEKVDLQAESYRKFPNQLSGGEQQRVAMVRALINNPRILFADEPTGALNSQNADHVLDVLSDFHHRGQSIMMVTHDIKSARRANRILYLHDGVVVAELELGQYTAGDTVRHQKLKDFLSELGW